MSGYTVLVLGAGASHAYGLPLGKGLVETICELLPKTSAHLVDDQAESLLNQLSMNQDAIRAWQQLSGRGAEYAILEFRQRLVNSDPKSIDEFLSRDFGQATTILRQIGKLSIAHVIAACESEVGFTNINNTQSRDHWYRYLWQDCLNAGCRNLDALRTKRLRIISFNYDRSLEYFLGKRIAATYLTPPGHALTDIRAEGWIKAGFEEIEDKLQITHPYGTLGSLLDVPYGDANNSKYHCADMAQRIRVIGEERHGNDDSFAVARNWIEEADRIVFLGFSYDATNMERLGLKEGLPRQRRADASIRHRDVFPLTYGLERAERIQLYSKYFSTHFDQNVEVVRDPSNDRTPLSELHWNISITKYLRQYGPLMNL